MAQVSEDPATVLSLAFHNLGDYIKVLESESTTTDHKRFKTFLLALVRISKQNKDPDFKDFVSEIILFFDKLHDIIDKQNNRVKSLLDVLEKMTTQEKENKRNYEQKLQLQRKSIKSLEK